MILFVWFFSFPEKKNAGAWKIPTFSYHISWLNDLKSNNIPDHNNNKPNSQIVKCFDIFIQSSVEAIESSDHVSIYGFLFDDSKANGMNSVQTEISKMANWIIATDQ